jgi:hypothetical protein
METVRKAFYFRSFVRRPAVPNRARHWQDAIYNFGVGHALGLPADNNQRVFVLPGLGIVQPSDPNPCQLP